MRTTVRVPQALRRHLRQAKEVPEHRFHFAQSDSHLAGFLQPGPVEYLLCLFHRAGNGVFLPMLPDNVGGTDGYPRRGLSSILLRASLVLRANRVCTIAEESKTILNWPLRGEDRTIEASQPIMQQL